MGKCHGAPTEEDWDADCIAVVSSAGCSQTTPSVPDDKSSVEMHNEASSHDVQPSDDPSAVVGGGSVDPVQVPETVTAPLSGSIE
jgi:hypothetical protein